MKKIDNRKILEIVKRGTVLDTDGDILYDLCNTVLYSHFPNREEHKEELIQEAILGILGLVDEGNFDESKGDAFTFLYGKARNVMTNYLYHVDTGKKRVHVFTDIESPIVEPQEIFYEQERTWTATLTTNQTDKVQISTKEGELLDLNEGIIGEIVKYVDSLLLEYGIECELATYIKAYFYDKLGVKYMCIQPNDFSYDFIKKYRYYVNLVGYMVYKKYMGGKVYENNIVDILDILEAEGNISFETRMFFDSLTGEQKKHLLYVFEGMCFTMPNKGEIETTDEYLTLYNRLKRGNLTVEQVARTYDRPLQTVLAVQQRFDNIFKTIGDE